RADKITMTAHRGQVLIVTKTASQAHTMEGQRPQIPKLVMTSPHAGDMGAVSEAARMLVAAERPMVIPERYARTPNGVKLLIELAELLQAPVNNRERMNFPNRHPLAGNGGPGYQPDVTLALEVQDI